MTTETPRDSRRINVLHFAGAGPFGPHDPTWGIIFPETIGPLEGYIREPNPTIRQIARKWVDAVKKICGVDSLSNINLLFSEQFQKKEIRRRFKEAFAQRHRIITTDRGVSAIDYGITLSNTRNNEITSLSSVEIDDLMEESYSLARGFRDFLQNPQNGLLRGLSNILPGTVNEIRDIVQPEDLLLLMFSPKWGEQARFEARQIHGIADIIAEVLLHRRKYQGVKDKIYDILNHHGVFKKVQHGPRKRSFDYLTIHNPHTFYVEGIQLIGPDDKYDPQPNMLLNSLKVRVAEDSYGEYLLQINDEPKGIYQTVLKMIRRNTLDPAEIRDHYRMAVTLTDRADIDRFLNAVREASRKAGNPIVIDHVENSLDGDKYEAKTEQVSERYPGSSEKYQVLRKKLYFEGRKEVFWELSCYTLESLANYYTANNTGIGEYLIRRLVEYDLEKADQSVFEYVIPRYIYGVDASEYLEALISGVRASVREKAFVHNLHTSNRPIFMSEEKITKAVDKIAEQIQLHSATERPDYDRWPEIIIAVGPNALTAASALASRFKSQLPNVLIFNAKASQAKEFIDAHSEGEFIGKNVLILDDVGVNAKTAFALKSALEKLQHRQKRIDIGFLAVKRGSPVSSSNPYSGSEFSDGEYIFFPPQLHEFVQHTQSVFAVCYRFNNGQLEVLVQEEEKDGINKIKLIGGTWDDKRRSDESTLETLRWEIDEELGQKMRRAISARLINRFPINVQVRLDPDGPKVPANLLNIRAYYVNGQGLDISNFTPPKDSNVKKIYFLPIDDAIENVYREGYKIILRKAKEELPLVDT